MIKERHEPKPALRHGGSLRKRIFKHARTPPCLTPERIDYLQKWKAMKIGVSRVDLPNPVLAHQDRCVRIVHDIA